MFAQILKGALVGVVLVVACTAAQAQDLSPAAKASLDQAIAAANSGDATAAFTHLKTGYAADQKILGVADSATMDKILEGLKSKADATAGDAALRKSYAEMLFFRGDYTTSLAEYRKVASQTPSDTEVADQIRTLESYTSGSGASGGSSGSSPGSGSGGAGSSGGYSSGSSGSTGSGGAGSSGGTGTSDTSSGGSSGGGTAAAGDAGGEVETLKTQLKAKDDEIAALQKEKEEFGKKVEEYEKTIKELQVYKTQLLLKGGLGR